MTAVAPEERLVAAIAALILDPGAPPARHVAVGAASPIPAITPVDFLSQLAPTS